MGSVKSLILAFSILLNSVADVDSVSINQVFTQQVPHLMAGYSISTGIVYGSCSSFGGVTKASNDFYSNLIKIESNLTIQENLVPLQKSLSYSWLKETIDYESNRLTVLFGDTYFTRHVVSTLRMDRYYSSAESKDMKLSDAAKTLLEVQNFFTFYQTCGPTYIRSVRRSAEMVAIVKFLTRSTVTSPVVLELVKGGSEGISNINVVSRFRGCYKDDFQRRALPDYIGSGMNLNRCGRRCSDKGWNFFGIQGESECYCGYGPSEVGEDVPHYAIHGQLPRSQCSCGKSNVGALRNCVYQITADRVNDDIITLQDRSETSASQTMSTNIRVFGMGLGDKTSASMEKPGNSLIASSAVELREVIEFCFLQMQDEFSGTVVSVDVLPWIFNPNFLVASQFSKKTVSNGSEDGAISKISTARRKYNLMSNAEFLSQVDEIYQSKISEFRTAQQCTTLLQQKPSNLRQNFLSNYNDISQPFDNETIQALTLGSSIMVEEIDFKYSTVGRLLDLFTSDPIFPGHYVVSFQIMFEISDYYNGFYIPCISALSQANSAVVGGVMASSHWTDLEKCNDQLCLLPTGIYDNVLGRCRLQTEGAQLLQKKSLIEFYCMPAVREETYLL